MEPEIQIGNLREQFEKELTDVKNMKEYGEFKVSYLGKKGPDQELSKMLGSLEPEKRREFGMKINELRNYITEKLEELKVKLEEEAINEKIANESIDVTLPATKVNVGGTHPMNRIVDQIEELFVGMGYDVVTGPEMETDLYNFEYLNVPKDHPARDAQDSFYINDEMLLRTQTSAAQVRTMLANEDKSPIRVISPGKVFRRDDDDATHSHQFMQIEGLVVDRDISMAHLKGTLEMFAKEMFGKDREVRFRPSYFPFTEPSIEVDVSCFNCSWEGCSICKNTGWIEILGSGMVHPNVLKMCGYDPEIYTGFAFGMGVERIAMLKYGITDIRDFYTNDLRFLEQFNRTEGGE